MIIKENYKYQQLFNINKMLDKKQIFDQWLNYANKNNISLVYSLVPFSSIKFKSVKPSKSLLNWVALKNKNPNEMSPAEHWKYFDNFIKLKWGIQSINLEGIHNPLTGIWEYKNNKIHITVGLMRYKALLYTELIQVPVFINFLDGIPKLPFDYYHINSFEKMLNYMDYDKNNGYCFFYNFQSVDNIHVEKPEYNYIDNIKNIDEIFLNKNISLEIHPRTIEIEKSSYISHYGYEEIFDNSWPMDIIIRTNSYDDFIKFKNKLSKIIYNNRIFETKKINTPYNLQFNFIPLSSTNELQINNYINNKYKLYKNKFVIYLDDSLCDLYSEHFWSMFYFIDMKYPLCKIKNNLIMILNFSHISWNEKIDIFSQNDTFGNIIFSDKLHLLKIKY